MTSRAPGLDPQTRLLLWEIIREYNQKGRTILLTTHNMEEADALCRQLAIIDHGHIIASGNAGGAQGFNSGRISPAAAVCDVLGALLETARGPSGGDGSARLR